LVPVTALLLGLGTTHVFSKIAVFFSKMAVVTFGGAYAVLAYVAQQAVENYHWLKPGEMLDGLGMAETNARPFDHGAANSWASWRRIAMPARCRRCSPARSAAHCHLGDVHAVLPVDFPRRALRRIDSRQTSRWRSPVGHHRRRGRVILNLAIWFAVHTVFRDANPDPRLMASPSTRRYRRASMGGRWRCRPPPHRDLPLQGRDDVDARGCCFAGIVLFSLGVLS